MRIGVDEESVVRNSTVLWGWKVALSQCKTVISFVVFAMSSFAVTAAEPELRGMWTSRFEWPHADEATCKQRIDTIMQQASQANFNAIFFQIRGQMDVFYPSSEVWSPLIGGVDPGWDPVAYAIAKAHEYGLEFHAYINTHTCWRSDTLSEPTNPDHIFYQHFNASDPNARDWLIHDQSGNPEQWHENEYVWVAPGVLQFQSYIREQVLYVVQNYDVDGVHFDRIRTPNSEYSYDPISMVRFASPYGNPNGLSFHYWTADQITRTVRDIYAAIMEIKPWVKVSAAVFYNPANMVVNQHQNAMAWIQDGSVDMLVPMMYFTGGEGSPWDAYLQQWLNGAGQRHIVAGHITTQGRDSLLEQVSLARLRQAAGNCVFSWASFTFWQDYLDQVYQVPTTVPEMEWKKGGAGGTAGMDGIVVGNVMDTAGNPVIDGLVTCNESTHIAITSGDGFYSFLSVPNTTVELTFTNNGLICETKSTAVSPLRVSRVDAVCPADCNDNGVADDQDILGGTSSDCDTNSIPDECEEYSDCQGNGVADFCDVVDGTSTDCDGDGVPDECQSAADCNGNSRQDFCDIAWGTSTDCNHNGIPDECESAADCNANGVADICEPQADCNNNAVQDICDVIPGGGSDDCNTNGVPDECELSGVVFHEDFEEPLSSEWAATGLWHLTGQCPRSSDCDPLFWAYYGEDATCNFDTGGTTSGSLSRLPVTIPTGQTTTLMYCSSYAGESGTAPSGWDSAWVTANGVIIDDVGAAGNHTDWEIRSVDVTAYAGQSATFAWNFDSGDGVSNSDLGWQIDDIELVAGSGSASDCNDNGVIDECDISSGASFDTNHNGIPDECESYDDCNGNGVDDLYDVASGVSYDCNSNSVPDECEGQDDCNSNGIPDVCEHMEVIVASLLSTDFASAFPPIGWGADGLWHDSDSCSVSGSCGQAPWAYFGNEGLCNFVTGVPASTRSTGVLSSPAVEVDSGFDELVLEYCSYYEGEAGASGRGGWDWAYVTVNGEIVDDVSIEGVKGAWETRTIGLDSFIGSSVIVEWHFDSRDGTNNEDLGWLVDGVSLRGIDYIDRECNGNGVLDSCDIDSGVSSDVDNNGVPDECQPAPIDCDESGKTDFGDLLMMLYCMQGPDYKFNPTHDCQCADGDGDRDIDLADFSILQLWLTTE